MTANRYSKIRFVMWFYYLYIITKALNRNNNDINNV